MRTYEELQETLGSAVALQREGRAQHVVVVLPSMSLVESVEAAYGDRLPTLEHRFLLTMTRLHRLPRCELVFVLSVAPDPLVWDYHLNLGAPPDASGLAGRVHLVTPDDLTRRPLARKLLDRGDLLDQIGDLVAGRPALIEPYNVTDAEVEVAVRLQLPIHGAAPSLAPLGYKSAGRRLFAEAGIPVPTGREDVRTVDEVISAALAIRGARPRAQSVVVKLDNSVSGVGNVVLDLPTAQGGATGDHLRERLAGLPPWYVDELALGAVVEQCVVGQQFRSPSVQADIDPGGGVVVRGTHEQDLAGPHGQTYQGCRFPADPAYCAQLFQHAHAVGRILARRGVVGRFSLDFAATWQPGHGWAVYGLEVNLRQGGTSPPLDLLANLDPGRYEPDPGRWRSDAGGERCYRSTDNLVDPRWTGLAPARVIEAVRAAGLSWERSRRTGIVLHLLSCLAVDGRVGLTAIAPTSQEADDLFDDAVRVLERLLI